MITRKIKILITIFSFFLMFLISCNDYTRSEITMYYIDSVPKLEVFYKLYGNKEYIAKEVRYYPSGIIMSEGTFNPKEEKEGTWTSYFENGKKWRVETYLNDMKDGEIIEWYKSGKKMYQGFYTKNLPDGKWILYDEEGKKISTINYKLGEVVNDEK